MATESESEAKSGMWITESEQAVDVSHLPYVHISICGSRINVISSVMVVQPSGSSSFLREQSTGTDVHV